MDEQAFIEKDILGYLEAHQRKELLRFTTVGSVDDGKSTLIGRLLYDAKGLYEDQLRAVERASSQKSDQIDLSLVTDGLKAEREQGITIDVAYRYFSTDKRKFIIADTPGHVQYTRNMATGASTANVAIILIDARLGVLQQSRRHAFIASLLGIPHLAVCVNKMDLKNYDQGVYEEIRGVFTAFAGQLGFKDITFFPISALKGDNIVKKSAATPWYSGSTLLEHLETVPVAGDRNYADFRFPVQYVLRPNLDYRGFSGEISSGVVKKGDRVMVLPSRKITRVKAIDVYEKELDSASAPMGVTLRLEDEIDISRGDMLVHPDNVPTSSQSFEAMMVWMSERPLDREKSYLLKHTSHTVRAEVAEVVGVVNLETLEEVPGAGLSLNDIGRVRVRCHKAIHFDPYKRSRSTGAFILIDSLTNNTVAAGMIAGGDTTRGARADEVRGDHSQVSTAERRERLGQSGVVVSISGGAAHDAASLAYAVERRLFDAGRVATVVGEEAGSTALTLGEFAARAGLVALVSAPDAGAGSAIPASGGPLRLGVHIGKANGAAGADLTVTVKDGDVDLAAEAVVRLLEEKKIFG